jgi:hypothetical protein
MEDHPYCPWILSKIEKPKNYILEFVIKGYLFSDHIFSNKYLNKMAIWKIKIVHGAVQKQRNLKKGCNYRSYIFR